MSLRSTEHIYIYKHLVIALLFPDTLLSTFPFLSGCFHEKSKAKQTERNYAFLLLYYVKEKKKETDTWETAIGASIIIRLTASNDLTSFLKLNEQMKWLITKMYFFLSLW